MAVNIVSCRRTLCYAFFALIHAAYVSMETECFYTSGTSGTFRFLQSFKCEHGCCGTTEHQRCCEKPADDGTAWKLAAIALSGCTLILVVTLLCCCIQKKKNKRNMRVRNRGEWNNDEVLTPRNGIDIFAMSHMRGEPLPKPPPYSYSEPPGSAAIHVGSEVPGASRNIPGWTVGGESSVHVHGGRIEQRESMTALPPPYTQ